MRQEKAERPRRDEVSGAATKRKRYRGREDGSMKRGVDEEDGLLYQGSRHRKRLTLRKSRDTGYYDKSHETVVGKTYDAIIKRRMGTPQDTKMATLKRIGPAAQLKKLHITTDFLQLMGAPEATPEKLFEEAKELKVGGEKFDIPATGSCEMRAQLIMDWLTSKKGRGAVRYKLTFPEESLWTYHIATAVLGVDGSYWILDTSLTNEPLSPEDWAVRLYNEERIKLEGGGDEEKRSEIADLLDAEIKALEGKHQPNATTGDDEEVQEYGEEEAGGVTRQGEIGEEEEEEEYEEDESWTEEEAPTGDYVKGLKERRDMLRKGMSGWSEESAKVNCEKLDQIHIMTKNDLLNIYLYVLKQGGKEDIYEAELKKMKDEEKLKVLYDGLWMEYRQQVEGLRGGSRWPQVVRESTASPRFEQRGAKRRRLEGLSGNRF